MFEVLFGWRKASRCKKLIRRVQCRLKLLKNKRDSIIRHLREDVAQLIKNGKDQTAFARVEQLFKDQSIMAVYDLLDHFCEFIIINLPYIRRHRDCPNDVNEAVSSLLFASARCGDLPELHKLRKLFGERYGHKFAMAAVELCSGNLVNRQIIEKLCMKSIPDDAKLRLMKEIARDNNLQLGHPETDGRSELQHHQVYDLAFRNCDHEYEEQTSVRDIQFTYNGIGGTRLQALNDKDMQGNARSYSSSSDWKKLVVNPCHSYSCSGITNNSAGASIVVQPAPDIVETLSSNMMHKSAVQVKKHDQLDPLNEPEMIPDRSSGQSNPGSCSSSRLSSANLQHKVERITEAASESSPQFSERIIVYLDDIEEFQPSTQEDGKDKDQRLFMFKTTIPNLRNNSGANRASLSDLYHDGYTDIHTEPCEPSDGKTSSRSTSKRRKSARKRRLKRRYVSLEKQTYHSCTSLDLSKKDLESALYYGEAGDYSPTGDLLSRSSHRRKHQRKMSVEVSHSSSFSSRGKKLLSPQRAYYAWKTPEGFCSEEMGENHLSHKCKYNQRRTHMRCNFNHDMADDCCLEHPCYIFTSDDNADWESPSPRQRSGTTKLVDFPYHNLQRGKCEEDHRHCSSGEEASNTTVATNRKSCKQVTGKATSNMRDQEMGQASPPQKPRVIRDYKNSGVVHAVIACQNYRHNEQRKEAEEAAEVLDCRVICASSRSSCSMMMSPWKQTRPPYLRAMTMPPERHKGTPTDQVLRSASCQFQQPNHSNSSSSSSCHHIHPKLPDYDDLEAKFMALKKEHLQSSTHKVNNGLGRS